MRKMQQMTGPLGLLNPFALSQFGAYGAYAQVPVSTPAANTPIPGILHVHF